MKHQYRTLTLGGSGFLAGCLIFAWNPRRAEAERSSAQDNRSAAPVAERTIDPSTGSAHDAAKYAEEIASLRSKIQQQAGRKKYYADPEELGEFLGPLTDQASNLPTGAIRNQLAEVVKESDPAVARLMSDLLVSAWAVTRPEEALEYAARTYPAGKDYKEVSYGLVAAYRRFMAVSSTRGLAWLESHREVRIPLLPVLLDRMVVAERDYTRVAALNALDTRWNVGDALYEAGSRNPADISKIAESLRGLPPGPNLERVAYDIGQAQLSHLLTESQGQDWINVLIEKTGGKKLQMQMEKGRSKTHRSFIWTIEEGTGF